MSMSRKHSRQRATFIGGLVGIIIIFTFVISLINPGSGSSRNSQVELPTITPFGTPPEPTKVVFPTPDADINSLTGERPYIHSSGYFQTYNPGWATDERQGENDGIAKVIFQSGARLAVIHNYVQPGASFESVDTLSTNYLDATYFATAWNDYDSWEETGRTIEGETVTVDFQLVSKENSYLGQDITRMDDGKLYVTRLVVPANNPELLTELHDLVLPNFIGYHDLQALPMSWPAYIDQDQGFIMKHALNWQQVAGDVGRPVTFKAAGEQDEATIRIWVEPDQTLTSAEDAAAWVLETEPTATVLATEPIEHEFGSGYQVAYTYNDTAGDAHSGLMIMLTNPQGALVSANLQIVSPDINLLDPAAVPEDRVQEVNALTTGFITLPPSAVEAITAPSADSTQTPTEEAAQ